MTNQTYSPAQAEQVQIQPRNGMGTAALVLGIIGILLAWIPIIGFLGFVLGILAIILGVVGIVRARKGRATNLVMAAIGTGLGALAFVVSTVVFGLFVSEVDKQINSDGTISESVPAAQDQQSSADQQGSADQQPAVAQFGDTHTWSGGEAITIAAPREHTPDNQFMAAPEGKRYVATDVTVRNGSDRPYQVVGAVLTAQHGGHVAQEEFLAGGDTLPNAEIPPGGEVTFTKIWKINAQPGELQLSVKPNPVAGKTVFFKGEF